MNTWPPPENSNRTTMKKLFFFALAGLIATSCDRGKTSDAYGNFEAVEVILSSETSGKVIFLDPAEGQEIMAGDTIALIDTTDLSLRRDQLVSQNAVLVARSRNIDAQIDVLEQQKKNTLTDKNRVENLLKDGAATQKQLDDLNGALDLINQQIRSTSVQKESVIAEMTTLDIQVAQVRESIRKSWILSPMEGTVLLRFAEPGEITTVGKPLVKLARLGEMDLKVYVSGDQLPYLKLGGNVDVLIDESADRVSRLSGRVSWISSKAEFTPKTIQTRKERVHLVYAAKVTVVNDGRLKIGMPGEINFMPSSR
jgi:HlyD family secretion protein